MVSSLTCAWLFSSASEQNIGNPMAMFVSLLSLWKDELFGSGLKASITCSTLSWSSNMKVTFCLNGQRSSASYWLRMTTKKIETCVPFPFHPHSGKCGRTFCSRSDWCRNKGYRERLADPSFASIIRNLPHQSATVAWELLLSYVSLHISHGYISKCQCVLNRFNSSVMPPEALLGAAKFHFHVSISLFKTDDPLYQSKVLSTSIGLTRCFGERTCTWRISQSRSLLGIILLACCVHASCFMCQQLTIVAWKPLLPCI